MDCKYYIQIGSEAAIVITNPLPSGVYSADDCISNLSDVEMSLDRKDLSGLIKKLSNSWEFVGDIRDRLVDYYLANPLQPKAAILVQCINPSTFSYIKLWECPLDFSTFSFDTYKCSINCLESGVHALVKAHKSTDYEYDVATLKETNPLYYDGVKNLKSYGLNQGFTSESGYSFNIYPHKVGCYPLYAPSNVMSQAVLIQDTPYKPIDAPEENLLEDDRNCVAIALKPVTITIDFSNVIPTSTLGLSNDVQVRALVRKKDGTSGGSTLLLYGEPHIGSTTWTGYKRGITLAVDEGIVIYIEHFNSLHENEIAISFAENIQPIISWGERATPVNMNVIKPITLLQSLVDSMVGGSNIAKAQIQPQTLPTSTPETVLANTLILPAESVRNLENQKIKTKFNDFCDFMEATFGYTYRILAVGEGTDISTGQPNTKPMIEFLHRDILFAKTFDGNRLNATIIKQIAEPQYSVDSSKMYANVEIGYEKQDYDEDNAGRYEFNATNKYTTGCTLTDSTLQLICPYRADSYGLEELVIKTSTTKSTDSDDDIFIIHSVNDTANNRYTLHRGGDYTIAHTYDPSSNFNVALAPLFCIKRNISYLRMTTSLLKFVSMDTPSVGCDGEHSIQINGIPISTDISGWFSGIEPLFLPALIEVRTADNAFPSNPNLPIVFNWNEKNYYGYISSLDIKTDREESAKYKLLFCRSVALPLWTDNAQTNRDHYDEAEDPQINLGDYSNDYNDDFNNGR